MFSLCLIVASFGLIVFFIMPVIVGELYLNLFRRKINRYACRSFIRFWLLYISFFLWTLGFLVFSVRGCWLCDCITEYIYGIVGQFIGDVFGCVIVGLSVMLIKFRKFYLVILFVDAWLSCVFSKGLLAV